MSTPSTLRFRARGTALVPHFEREDAGIRCFVGRRRAEPSAGRLAFAPTDETEEVPYRQEYVKACADGDLFAADEVTAKVCNTYARAHGLPKVTYDPSFGTAKTGPVAPGTKDEPKTASVEAGTTGDADAARLLREGEQTTIVIDDDHHDELADDSAEKGV